MATNYDDLDLEFTWNGDFVLGSDKDLGDTARDGLLSLKQELHTICASELGDWEVYPGIGATLSDYVGEPNIEPTADAIHDRLRVSIVNANLVKEEDLEIRVVPVHRHRVMVVIRVNAVPSSVNELGDDQVVVTSLVFDFIEQGIFFLDKVPRLIK